MGPFHPELETTRRTRSGGEVRGNERRLTKYLVDRRTWELLNRGEATEQLMTGCDGTKTMLGDVNNETIGHANLKNRSERTESLKRK